MSYRDRLCALVLGGALALASACSESAIGPDGSTPGKEPGNAAGRSRLVYSRCVETGGSWPSEEDFICFASGLVIIEPDGSEKYLFRKPVTGLLFDTEPAWSPDGQTIAFTGLRHCGAEEVHSCASEIYLMKPDGTGATRLTHSPSTRNSQAAWSPDGRRIAYVASARDGQGPAPQLRVVDVDGSGAKSLGNLSGTGPAWSPDGKRIAFSTGAAAAEPGIYVADADGSNPTRLTGEPGVEDSEPAWSPDGRTLAFTRSPRPPSIAVCQVWVMGADGSNPRALTRESTCARAPAWAPDGKVAFNAGRGILVMNADGTGLRYVRSPDQLLLQSRVSWGPLP